MADQPTSPLAPAKNADAPNPKRQLVKSWVTLLLAVALAVGLIASVPGLNGVGTSLGQAKPGWVALAVALEVLSNIGYTLTMMLVFPRIPKRFAARLGWSESAFGAAVTVGGLGNLALGGWVLHRVGMSKSRIVERSAVLFIATSAVNVIVLAITGLGVGLHLFSGPSNPLLGFVPGIVGVLATLAFIALPYVVSRSPGLRTSTSRWAKSLRVVAEGVDGAVGVLRSMKWETVGAWAYLLCDIGVLYVALRALGQRPSFAVVVLAYQIGQLTDFIPVPAGIGVLDAGLAGMLVVYGLKSTPATAAVVIYHAIFLVVPLAIGTVGFFLVRRQMPTIARLPQAETAPTADASRRAESHATDDAADDQNAA